MKHKLFVTALLAVLLGSAVILNAQSASGTITGVVTDASGSAISGAEVKVTNQLTGIVQKTTTTGPGDYSFPILPVGLYWSLPTQGASARTAARILP